MNDTCSDGNGRFEVTPLQRLMPLHTARRESLTARVGREHVDDIRSLGDRVKSGPLSVQLEIRSLR